MGCISSTRKLHAYKNENTFHVTIIRLQPQIAFVPRHGMLELTPKELIFTTTNKEQIVWALQHLRRYGVNGNIFSFEAGRRSANGPGIYTFRCYKADVLYQKFQRYVNAASNIRERDRSTIIGQITILRSNANLHTTHFLEPTVVQTMNSTHPMQDGNDSLHDFATLTSETNLTEPTQNALLTTDIPDWPRASSYSNIDPRAINKNIYVAQPLIINFENNTMLNDNTEENSGNILVNSGTLEEISQQKGSSLETISTNYPVSSHSFSDDQRYINISNGESIIKQKKIEHYYENLSRTDLKQLLKSCSSLLHMSAKATSANDTGVNYVVLDLDKSGSPKHSTKPKLCSDFSLSFDNTNNVSKNSKNQSIYNTIKMVNSSATCKEYQHLNKETSPGYSTIDFIKTCALIKSSINYPELNIDQDNRELRMTRHSK